MWLYPKSWAAYQPEESSESTDKVGCFLVIAPETGPSQPPKGKETNRLLTVPSIFQVRFDVSFRENSRFNGFFLPLKKRHNAGIVVGRCRFRA